MTLPILALSGTAVYQMTRPRLPGPGTGTIAVAGGEEMSVLLPGIRDAYYAQGDTRWGTDRLGPTRELLRNAGCTVSAVAMASTALGFKITPGELNARLHSGGGFTDRGWLIWGAVPAATAGSVEVVVYDQPTFGRIDQALGTGEFPVVKYFLKGGIPHWVLVVGKEGRHYRVYDPSSAKSGPTLLSDRARAIHSLRVVRRVRA